MGNGLVGIDDLGLKEDPNPPERGEKRTQTRFWVGKKSRFGVMKMIGRLCTTQKKLWPQRGRISTEE